MNSPPGWTDLRSVPSDRWITAVLKGTDTEVELVVLHHDPSSGAAVSLVQFPPGLTRTTPGCYPAAEELAIVSGSLDFAGHTFVAGDYTYVAPRVLRPPMVSPDGLLVLAWFSGTPTWLTDESERLPGAVVRKQLIPGTLRDSSPDVPGRTTVANGIDSGASDVGRDVLDIEGGRWCFVAPGQRAPSCDGPVQIRVWP